MMQLGQQAPQSKGIPFPMVIEGSTSDPTKADAPDVDSAVYHRLGHLMAIYYSYQHTTSTGAANGSGTYKFLLPVGFTMDTTQLPTAVGVLPVGSVHAFGTATSSVMGVVYLFNSTAISLRIGKDTIAPSSVSSSLINLNQATVQYQFMATIPILEWS